MLPTSEIAGSLVGSLLTRLHPYGALAGIPLARIPRSLGRGRLSVAAPLVLSVLRLYSHFGVSVELAEIRDLSFGLGGNPDIAARFRFLDRNSIAGFIAVGVVVTILIGVHARADARPLGRRHGRLDRYPTQAERTRKDAIGRRIS